MESQTGHIIVVCMLGNRRYCETQVVQALIGPATAHFQCVSKVCTVYLVKVKRMSPTPLPKVWAKGLHRYLRCGPQASTFLYPADSRLSSTYNCTSSTPHPPTPRVQGPVPCEAWIPASRIAPRALEAPLLFWRNCPCHAVRSVARRQRPRAAPTRGPGG